MKILSFRDTTTVISLSKISFKKFERFEVSLSNFRDRENPYERESTQYFALLILYGLIMYKVLYFVYYMHIVYHMYHLFRKRILVFNRV